MARCLLEGVDRGETSVYPCGIGLLRLVEVEPENMLLTKSDCTAFGSSSWEASANRLKVDVIVYS
jgi:hypothetical protein